MKNKLPQISFIGHAFKQRAEEIVNTGDKLGLKIIIVNDDMSNSDFNKHVAEKCYGIYALNASDAKDVFLEIKNNFLDNKKFA